MWEVELQVDDELDGVTPPLSDAVTRNNPRVVGVGDDHEVPYLKMDITV
jgi:hypothetical protein